MAMGGCWIVEVDIRKFFDTLVHHHLKEIVSRRVRDGVICRMINRWLHAGVLEGAELSYPEAGTPQGGVISPLLANVYLDTVLDKWFVHELRPSLKGEAFLVRYADDFVMGFTREADAHAVLAELPVRFGQYGLTIHPTKTRLVDFRRPGRLWTGTKESDRGLPTSFDFLGLNHHWGRSKRGYTVIKQSTAKDRFRRSLRKASEWCAANRHLKVREQSRILSMKLRGHYGYYGLTGNYPRLARFYRAVVRIWRYWLNRRSQRRKMTWERFNDVLKRWPLHQPNVPNSVFKRAAKA
jgi:group II intron reverse transcriptase/maturase